MHHIPNYDSVKHHNTCVSVNHRINMHDSVERHINTCDSAEHHNNTYDSVAHHVPTHDSGEHYINTHDSVEHQKSPVGDKVTSRQLLRCIIPQAVNTV